MAVQKDDAANTVAATPGVSPAASGPNLFVRIKRFLREVRDELKKTNWPSRNELTKFTVVVIVTIVSVALFLFVCDVVAARIMEAVGITHATQPNLYR